MFCFEIGNEAFVGLNPHSEKRIPEKEKKKATNSFNRYELWRFYIT